MNDLISVFKKDLFKLIEDLQNKKIINEFDLGNISIDYSSKSKKGDLSTNILLILDRKKLDKSFNLKDYVNNYFVDLIYVENIEIAKAGFINIFIKKDFIIEKLKNFFDLSTIYLNKIKQKQKINIEFVSANPTGPIHIAHMRGAVLGDVLASILESVGHNITREYYVNDAGSQIAVLGLSLFKRYQELFGIKVDFDEGEYPGEYLIEIAKKIINSDGDKWISHKDVSVRKSYFERYGVNFLIDNIKSDLSLIGINFDKFTFESDIVKNKFIDKVFILLKEKKLLYEGILEKPLGEDSEIWKPRKQLLFRSKKFSDDTDRPFQKANGEWTYFANDSAYHYEKYLRGFDQLINIWGSDHVGYIARMKSMVDIISKKNDYLEILTCQLVRLIKDGEILKMSKRDGNFITLKDVHNEVGKDALRYFMISTKNETPMDFNLNKVIEKNKDNPVFYCQYAYARASSVIKKSKKFKNIPNINESFDLFDLSSVSKYEWKIILKILSWPYVLYQTAESKQPHRITNYLEDLCSEFHSFWNKGKDDTSLRMLDENNIDRTITKLVWIESFRKTLYQAFKIIGISSREIM